MAKEAGTNALTDAGIAYDEIEQVAVGYCYGDSTAGQRALYEIGVSGVPVVNVNNNCATGSSALYLAKRFIEGGLADCTLALGFEKMEKGSLGIKYMDRAMPMQRTFEAMNDKRGFTSAPPAPQMFGNAGREYMERYGVKAESFARIAEKNHRHSANNPYSSSATSTRSTRSWRRRWCTSRSPSCSAARPPTARPPRSSRARSSCGRTASRTRPSRSSACR